jgi:hypothetical protein
MALRGQREDTLRQSSAFAILPRVAASDRIDNTAGIIIMLLVDIAHDSQAMRSNKNSIAARTTIPPTRCNRTVLLLLSSCYCNKQRGGVEEWSHGAPRNKPIIQKTKRRIQDPILLKCGFGAMTKR